MGSSTKDVNDCQGIVYNIPCNDCDKGYIGNTGRKFSQRSKEHQYAVKSLNMNNSVSLHRHLEGHKPNLQKTTILHTERNKRARYNLETIEILDKKTNLINHLIPENIPLLDWSKLINSVSEKNELLKKTVCLLKFGRKYMTQC